MFFDSSKHLASPEDVVEEVEVARPKDVPRPLASPSLCPTSAASSKYQAPYSKLDRRKLSDEPGTATWG